MTADPGLDWPDGAPRSRLYDDVYFSRVDGLAESRAVFLEGCGLPQAWAGRPRFTVAELGFGTGLNIAALLQLWRRTRGEGAHLSVFSIEAHPLTREDAARALKPWRTELPEEIDALLAAWPAGRRGLHRLDFPRWGATLDLCVAEAGEALAGWSGPADAWFLDGFAPSRNPQIWRDEVLAAVARLSAPGARAASFTVAGHVRRALAAHGFAVEKQPGFGAKRERLEARLPGLRTPSPDGLRVAVVGAGIAGAALMRAFHARGVACTLIEAEGLGAGASGNPAALVTPRLDAGFGPAAQLHAEAFARATALYAAETPGAILAQGALQLARGDQDTDRFARLAAWDGFAAGSLRVQEPDGVARRLDEAEADPPRNALLIAEALVVEPAAVLSTWLGDAARVVGEVARLERRGEAWLCLGEAGERLAEADVVCLAAGHATAALVPPLGLRPVRGQAEFTEAEVFTGAPAAWGAYAIPLRGGGVLFGASHLRGDAAPAPRPAETAANLKALEARRPALAARICALPAGQLRARASIRAATPDHLPLAGELEAGLFVLGGLGGRGFGLAPLLAEHVVALALGAPSPLPVDLGRRLRPGRFAAAENPQPPRPLCSQKSATED